jgi:hypothetical protein
VLKVFGVNPTVAAAYTLVLHAALWLPITLLGIWYIVSESFSWRDIGEAVEQGKASQNESDDTSTRSYRVTKVL